MRARALFLAGKYADSDKRYTIATTYYEKLEKELPDHRRLRVVDHRLFDLIPVEELPRGLTPIGFETRGVDGPAGDAITMIEWEIVDRSRQMLILRQKLDRGEVDREWFDDRTRVLTETYSDDARDQRLHLTSDYTLMGPVRYHLYRQVRRRAEALGRPLDLHEDMLPGATPRPSVAEAGVL